MDLIDVGLIAGTVAATWLTIEFARSEWRYWQAKRLDAEQRARRIFEESDKIAQLQKKYAKPLIEQWHQIQLLARPPLDNPGYVLRIGDGHEFGYFLQAINRSNTNGDLRYLGVPVSLTPGFEYPHFVRQITPEEVESSDLASGIRA